MCKNMALWATTISGIVLLSPQHRLEYLLSRPDLVGDSSEGLQILNSAPDTDISPQQRTNIISLM